MAQVFTVRASSWASLFDCAHRWEGVHILGMRNVAGLRAALGTATHAGTAAFDAARVSETPITVDDASSVLVDALHGAEFDASKDEDLSVQKAESIGLALLDQYCTEISPQFDFLAVEMETAPLEIDCGGGMVIRMTGTLDRSRVRHTDDGNSIADIKTGGAAVSKGVAKTRGHAPQVGTYELLFEHTTGQPVTAPATIIGMKTKGKPEIAVGEIPGAKAVMTGDASSEGLLAYAAAMFRTGMFPPNPSSMLCGERYCARWHVCRYHE